MNNKMFNSIMLGGLLLVVSVIIISILLPNFEEIPITHIYEELKEGKIAIVINGNKNVTNTYPIVVENNILLPTKIIKEYIDDDIFLNDEKYVVIVKDDKYIKIEAGNKKYYENYVEKEFKTVPISLDGEIYIPIEEFKNMYNLKFKYIEDRNIIILNDYDFLINESVILKETVIRERESYKGRIVSYVSKDEEVFVYSSNDKWSYILTKNGDIGYIKTKFLSPFSSNKNELDKIKLKNEKIEKEKLEKYSEKINLLWYQISSKNKNYKTKDLKKIDSLNVMCLTWFEMGKSDGTVREKISKEIVDWAHDNGMKVWGLVTNTFSDKNISYNLLSNVNSREKAIRELINYSKEYNLDGINVDIESISKETGPYFIQFVRELSVFTHLNNLVLSVDMYMPTEYNSFYGRKEIGKIADYYCLMAYDEHWRTSPTSGSVSSLPWVENGIVETLEVVPNHKLLLGIPSYTRRWGEKQDVIIKVDALSMDNAYNDLIKHNASIIYDESTGQNYGEYTLNNVRYRIWLEDETSLSKRLELAKQYELGGVCTWKYGFEKESIWQLYDKYMTSEIN